MITRRTLIAAALTLTGGVAIGVGIPPAQRLVNRLRPAQPLGPGAWIVIDADDSITLLSSVTEMGQGIWTCLAQIVADELDVDPARCRVEMAPTWRAYESVTSLDTGASSSTRKIFELFRPIAASARAMLIAAAAQEWSVPVDACSTSNGAVIHAASGRKQNFGALAARAARMEVSSHAPLKSRDSWRWIGRSLPRLDVPAKVNGSARFGIDATVPGMRVAAVSQAPFPGSRLLGLQRDKLPARARVIEGTDFVAVVDDNFWSAQRGLTSLQIHWEVPKFTTDALRNQLEQAAQQTPHITAEAADDQVIEATYFAPLLTHAQLEPLNALADARRFSAELTVSTQSQSGMKVAVADALGISPHAVTIRTDFVGGGFGRRLEADYGVTAALISRELGAPVKAIWSREEDALQARFRPMSVARMRATIRNQSIGSWDVSIAALGKTPGLSGLESPPYRLPRPTTRYTSVDAPVRIGFWRSVDYSQNMFFRECFVDECAQALQRDPLELRHELLADDPRARAVLRRVGEMSGWATRHERQDYLGLAFSEGFDSRCAQVAKLAREPDGKLRVSQIYVAFDCGTVVNPDGVRAQIEGGVLMGLSAALREAIHFENGQLVERNFDRYRLLRLSEAPEIVIDLLQTPDAEVGGVGEAGVPPVAPALANALFAAVGVRLRDLPLVREGLPLGY